ncbi:MAG: hypothetical protein AAB617_00900 [Patescibacteria group bacterium]
MHARNSKSVRVETLLLQSYLAFIKNSVGSKAFQEFYCLVNGKKLEVLQRGRVSCAFYLTSVLKIFSLVKNIQITIHRALDEMERSGWRRIHKPRVGAIIVWEEIKSDKDKNSKIFASSHKHMGFFVGNNRAVSTSTKKRVPIEHGLVYSGGQKSNRKIIAIYWHPRLNN